MQNIISLDMNFKLDTMEKIEDLINKMKEVEHLFHEYNESGKGHDEIAKILDSVRSIIYYDIRKGLVERQIQKDKVDRELFNERMFEKNELLEKMNEISNNFQKTDRSHATELTGIQTALVKLSRRLNSGIYIVTTAYLVLFVGTMIWVMLPHHEIPDTRMRMILTALTCLWILLTSVSVWTLKCLKPSDNEYSDLKRAVKDAKEKVGSLIKN